jgi:UPF0716 protein FxsA
MALLLLLVVAPIVELYVIIKVGGAIGVLNTIGLLILVAVIGSWLVKREGRKVWTRFNEQIAAGRVPSKEIADGICLLIAGALMIAPGFVSDVIALLLIFPPTRALFRRRFVRHGVPGRARVIRATYDSHGGRFRGYTDVSSTESPRRPDDDHRELEP